MRCAELLVLFAMSCPSAVLAQQVDTLALKREIPHLLETGRIPGISVAVVVDGHVYWKGAFGTVNDSVQSPTDTLTVFEAASLSKPLFAYVVMRLADRKVIDLDRPLAALLEYPRLASDPRYKQITARMVLSHGSGMPNSGGDSLGLRFDPGTGFQYSGEAYLYLQKTVERVTGLSLEELARQEAFEPLGMTRSSYVWQTRFAGNAAYAKDWAWRVAPISHFTSPSAAYTLVTTAGDYALFVAAVLNGTGLSTEMARAYLAPVRSVDQPWNPSLDNPHVWWSLGWGIEDDGRAGTGIFHGGSNGRRFRAWIEAFPSHKTGIVYFANSDGGDAIADALVSQVVQGDHEGLRWEQTPRHDDPRRQALIAVQEAAANGSIEAVLARYRAIRNDLTTRPAPSSSAALVEFLTQRGLSSAERPIAEMTVEDCPDSARALDMLAHALLMSHEYASAIAEQRKSLDIEPANAHAQRVLKWIEQSASARAQPLTLPSATLERYVGQYGERRVRLEGGRLYYKRGQNPEVALLPITEDLFALEGDESFRLRFVSDGIGPASKTLGLELNGNSFGILRSK